MVLVIHLKTLSKHASLASGRADWENHQNVAAAMIGNNKVTDRRVWTAHECCSDPVEPELGGPYYLGATKVARKAEIHTRACL